jgi:hypothetical protein
MQQIGNYVIEREIGRGATSEVWLAHHAYLEERQVAVKVLLSQDIETVQRFSHEANILSLLHHPNIIELYDHGHCDPYYYSVLEYIPGNSLQRFLDRKQRLDFAGALNIMKQIGAALDYAHRCGVIHRDVSPGNVLVDEEQERALLTDFGIARHPNQKITVNYKVMGTPGYWSPEQARSAKEVTHLSDIYGLGVLFYVMLSGDLPWDEIPGPNSHDFGPPMPLKQRNVTNVPADVDRVVQAMLAVDPAHRYPTAHDAIDELERMAFRHHAITQVNDKRAQANGHASTPATTPLSLDGILSCELSGVEENAVEKILGADLLRAPIARAHERARELCQPEVVSGLLNGWSQQGFYRGIFRRAMLGRLARLRSIRSYNVYFYRLQVLYEQRNEPQTIEKPDRDAKDIPLEPDVDLWHVTLPSVKEFEDEPGGQVVLPGSTRVVQCEKCHGKGKLTCSRCKGKGRVQITRPVEDPPARDPPAPRSASRQAQGAGTARTGQEAKAVRREVRQLSSYSAASASSSASGANRSVAGTATSQRTERVVVPCPTCEGRGGTACDTCEGTGRLVQSKAFQWHRTSQVLEDHEDLSFVDEQWFQKSCTAQQVYCERVFAKPKSDEPALRPEWSDIPVLRHLLHEAKEAHTPSGAGTRIILSELTITVIPVTEVTFDLDKNEDAPGTLYTLPICGFERAIPPDWRLLNWERVIFFWVNIFMLMVTLVCGYFAFVLW